MMRVVFTAAALLALAPASIAQQERITSFTSDIVVEKSGDLLVTETIAVIAGGDQIKHGIYRDFPTLYRSAFGLNRRVAFDVLEVTRDGKGEPSRTAPQQNGMRVYIGDPSQFVFSGLHVYTLRYRTNRQLVQRPDFDELYWNVTGNQWSFPIDHAVAKVTLPAGAAIKEINAYTGQSGERGRNWRIEPAGPWDAVIETTAPLAPNEGLTISVEWQKGIVDADANRETLLDIALDNRGVALALGGMVLVLAYYLVAWIWIGRDPRRGIIIPLYAPPEGFSPAEVRYLSGLGTFDNKSFAATVIDLAVHRALRIVSRSDKTYTLKRVQGADRLDLARRNFYRGLMGTETTLNMSNQEHAAFQTARDLLQKSLRSEIDKRYFLRNSGWWIAGLLLSLVPAIVAVNDAHNLALAAFMALWMSIWSLAVIALLTSAAGAWSSGHFLKALPTMLFAIPFVATWCFGAYLLVRETSPLIAGVFLLAFVINAVFYRLLKAPTLEGRRVMDQIDGFRRYLSIGEADRLNLENPPERTPEHFEAFLPYALALDVEQQWSAQFSELLAAAQYDPDWYHGGSGAFTVPATSFASSLGGAFAGAIASSSTAPGSSSGGGGGGGSGSSGGGGGGGGGGGW